MIITLKKKSKVSLSRSWYGEREFLRLDAAPRGFCSGFTTLYTFKFPLGGAPEP